MPFRTTPTSRSPASRVSPRLAPLVSTLALAALALAAGCAARPDIRHDRDPAVDLHAFKTFSFAGVDDGGASAADTGYTGLIDARMRAAARRELERLDYVYREQGGDLQVHMLLMVAERQELRPAPAGPRGYRGWGGVESVDYRQGSLTVDLVDPKRRALVWRGVAEGRVSDDAAAQPGPAVDAAVRDLFAAFPDGGPR